MFHFHSPVPRPDLRRPAGGAGLLAAGRLAPPGGRSQGPPWSEGAAGKKGGVWCGSLQTAGAEEGRTQMGPNHFKWQVPPSVSLPVFDCSTDLRRRATRGVR